MILKGMSRLAPLLVVLSAGRRCSAEAQFEYAIAADCKANSAHSTGNKGTCDCSCDCSGDCDCDVMCVVGDV